jgi:hypothetical protein
MSGNFVMGFEYEFFSEYDEYDIEEHLTEDVFGIRLGSKFEVVADPSLRIRDKKLYGWEIITPPLPEKQSIGVFHKVNQYLRNIDAKFNKTTGFHVNISYSDPKKMSKMDPRVLIATTDDYYLAKLFHRDKNTYCRPWKENVQILNNEIKRANRRSKTYKQWDLKTEFDRLVDAFYSDDYESTPILRRTMDLVDAKYSSININKLGQYGYVEYRMLGGDKYLDRETDILQSIEHFKESQLKAMNKANANVIPTYLDWATHG